MLRQIYHRLVSKINLSHTSAVCLMFHRIAEVQEEEIGPYPAITISPTAFESIMDFFSKHFRAMALPELVMLLAKGQSPPPNTFAVTFDDGFVDTWSVAKPILEKFEVPATVYITTGYIDGEVFPYEFELADLIAARDEVHFHWDGQECYWNLKNKQDRKRCYLEIKKIGKSLSYALRRNLMNNVRGGSKLLCPKSPLFMNWQQVAELSQSPLITIGAHTHRHTLLSSLTHENAREEIVSCKNILQANLNSKVHHFSYPYGALNEKVQSIVKNCGFTSAVGGEPGGIRPKPFDCYAISRLELKAPPSPTHQTLPEVLHACGYS